MRYALPAALLAATLLCQASFAQEKEEKDNPIAKLPWHSGPGSERIGPQAVLKTDAHLAFLDEASSRKFLELTGNIPEDGLYVLASSDNSWWATFTFEPMGYVKDDDKIDADELLDQER